MGQQILKRGEKVEFVGLIDTWNYIPGNERQENEFTLAKAAMLALPPKRTTRLCWH